MVCCGYKSCWWSHITQQPRPAVSLAVRTSKGNAVLSKWWVKQPSRARSPSWSFGNFINKLWAVSHSGMRPRIGLRRLRQCSGSVVVERPTKVDALVMAARSRRQNLTVLPHNERWSCTIQEQHPSVRSYSIVLSERQRDAMIQIKWNMSSKEPCNYPWSTNGQTAFLVLWTPHGNSADTDNHPFTGSWEFAVAALVESEWWDPM